MAHAQTFINRDRTMKTCVRMKDLGTLGIQNHIGFMGLRRRGAELRASGFRGCSGKKTPVYAVPLPVGRGRRSAGEA